jgi:N-(2-amino-2-carboxyethyl)-L-glutamate synthase
LEFAQGLRELGSAVGSTPLLNVGLRLNGQLRIIRVKLECTNPTGSVKDRTAFGLVRDCLEQGRLEKGSVLIESTSGNLGVALAFVAQRLGLEFIAVIDPKTSVENIVRMRQLGARIERVLEPDSEGGYLLSRLSRVRQILADDSERRMIWTDQYSNPANPAIHYYTTGPEIYKQMCQSVDAVFVAVSTGGTIAGIAQYLRETSPSTRLIAVDAEGSLALNGPPGPRHLTGIGASRHSSFVTQDLYDDCVKVSDKDAFAACRVVSDCTGLLIGGSSGAVLVGCARYLAMHPALERVVCIWADRGDNYRSSIFDDAWLRRIGIAHSFSSLPFQEFVLVDQLPAHSLPVLKGKVPTK